MSINKQMIKNIEEYSNRIISLESFVEAVRLRPGMYIGRIGAPGFLNMIREIFQNSVDQLLDPKSPCTHIRLSYDENTQEVIVEDNGLGIPHKDMVRVFTEQHTGSNFVREEGKFSSGLHGVGAKVTNALCSQFYVESFILGKGMRLDFIDGFPTTENPVKISKPDSKQGTRITFKPSIDIMGDFYLSGKDVYNLVRTIISLTPIGSTVYFKCITKNNGIIDEKIVNEDGIMSNMIMMTNKPLIQPIHIKHEQGDMKMEVVFTYDVNSKEGDQKTVAYSNFCPTTAGTHIDGFEEGMGAYFRKYMNDIVLGSNSKFRVNINDIRSGLRAVLNVAHIEPTFDGQSKEVLTNDDMRVYMKETMERELDIWAQSHPQELNRIATYLKNVAELRYKNEHGREKLSNKYAKSAITGFPDKYEPPTGNENLEFIIVEGNSAGGSAKNARCPKRQGIFPIRGKLPNCFSTPWKDLRNNAEIAGIINVILDGKPYTKNFDINDTKFEKIIFMTDADPDGAHINVLLLTLFLVYLRPLVEAERVYKANPPLYGIKETGKMLYFRDKLKYIEYMQTKFLKDHTVEMDNGTKLTNDDIQGLFYNNMEYSYELNVVANTYAINPLLLEMVLYNRGKTDKQLDKIINDRFRFLSVDTENDVRIVSGLANQKMQSLFLNKRFMNDANNIIKCIDNNTMYYKLDGETVSLYTLLSAFEQYNSKSHISRYKGLGEMNPDQLRVSTIHPDSNRVLMRYTIKDMEEDIIKMREIESNRKKLIEDITVSRHEIIGG